MEFAEILKFLPKIGKENLLGVVAHTKMAPLERIEALANVDFTKLNPRKAAVMMLLYPKGNQSYLALIKRNSYPGVHSAQIAFPGGQVEPVDVTLLDTALRETEEEIGIDSNQIQIIRPFSELYIPPSNFLVFPFLGVIHNEPEFQPQLEEVTQIVEFPVKDFLDEKSVVIRNIDTSYGKGLAVPTFQIEEHYIWGATAMMMSELKEVLKKVI